MSKTLKPGNVTPTSGIYRLQEQLLAGQTEVDDAGRDVALVDEGAERLRQRLHALFRTPDGDQHS